MGREEASALLAGDKHQEKKACLKVDPSGRPGMRANSIFKVVFGFLPETPLLKNLYNFLISLVL